MLASPRSLAEGQEFGGDVFDAVPEGFLEIAAELFGYSVDADQDFVLLRFASAFVVIRRDKLFLVPGALCLVSGEL